MHPALRRGSRGGKHLVAMCQAWLSLREQLACCALVLMQTLAAAECGRGWACRPVLTTLYACRRALAWRQGMRGCLAGLRNNTTPQCSALRGHAWHSGGRLPQPFFLSCRYRAAMRGMWTFYPSPAHGGPGTRQLPYYEHHAPGMLCQGSPSSGCCGAQKACLGAHTLSFIGRGLAGPCT